MERGMLVRVIVGIDEQVMKGLWAAFTSDENQIVDVGVWMKRKEKEEKKRTCANDAAKGKCTTKGKQPLSMI